MGKGVARLWNMKKHEETHTNTTSTTDRQAATHINTQKDTVNDTQTQTHTLALTEPHQNNIVWGCEWCELTFQSEELLDKHVETQHDGADEEEEQELGDIDIGIDDDDDGNDDTSNFFQVFS